MHDRAFRERFGRTPDEWFPELRRFAELGLLQRSHDDWVTTELGAYCVDGMAAQLASDAVLERVAVTNESILDPRRNLLEQHDYSPLGRSGASVAHPRARLRSVHE